MLPVAPAMSVPEYSLKAVFLFNFTEFVAWPENADNGPPRRQICVLGKNPFNDNLQKLVISREKQTEIKIHYTQSLEAIKHCHILFISRSEEYRITEVFHAIEHLPILTVSDILNFAARRGMIELSVKSERISLSVNLKSVRSSGIKLNSNLVELATVVSDDSDAGQASP